MGERASITCGNSENGKKRRLQSDIRTGNRHVGETAGVLANEFGSIDALSKASHDEMNYSGYRR